MKPVHEVHAAAGCCGAGWYGDLLHVLQPDCCVRVRHLGLHPFLNAVDRANEVRQSAPKSQANCTNRGSVDADL